MLFSNRDKFDLIALYDDSSRSLNDSPALAALSRAIYEIAFKKILKNIPMILVGGLRAWKEQFPHDIVHGGTETVMENPGPSTDPVRYNGYSQGADGVMSPRLNGNMVPMAGLPSSPPMNANVLSNHSRAPAESSTVPMFAQQMSSPPFNDPMNFSRTPSGGPSSDASEYRVWMPPPSAATPAPPDIPVALR